MNQVISFPTAFLKLKNDVNGVNNPEEYKALLKKKLDVFDYEEFMMACMDDDYYDTADDEIQQMVDNYHSLWEG